MTSPDRVQRSTLFSFLSIVGLLILIGLIFIYSSSSVFALERFGIAHYFVRKQVYGCCLSCIAAIICTCIPYSYLRSLAPLAFVCTLSATIFPLLLSRYAITIHGSTRWISYGTVSLQPSEFLKVAIILILARLLSSTRTHARTWRQTSIIGAIIIVSACSLLAQPDFGQAVLITTTSICMLLLVSPNLTHIALLIVAGGATSVLLVLAKPYRLKRILTFLYPWDDPRGAGFQIIQSLIALGSGKTWGIGIGQSHQKFFYLPMQHTDFIFPIIAEETGFVGSLIVISLFIGLLYTGYALAWSRKQLFPLLTIFGYTTMISLQAIMNLAVVTGLVPTKGIGLPFISYGVSSLLAHGCMIGIICSCTRK